MTIALAMAHALLFMAAFPPVGAWPLALVCMAPLVWLAVHARSTARAVVVVLVTQIGMWLWINRWIVAVTEPGYAAFSIYLAAYPPLFAWGIRRFVRTGLLAAWPMAVLAPMFWVGVECLRGELAFHGYPWFLIGHPLVEAPVLAQSADLLGSYFVSFLGAMCSGLLVDAARAATGAMTWAGLARSAGLVAMLWAGNIAYGSWRLHETGSLSAGPRVLAIQTNLPQDNKTEWPAEAQVEAFVEFRAQTEQALAEAREAGLTIDLIVWPETMLPGRGLDEPSLRAQREAHDIGASFAEAVESLQKKLGIPMLLGSAAFEGLRLAGERWEWDRHYNSAYLVHGEPPYQRYDKFFLTPFGETMPYISAWPWLQQAMLDLGARGMKFDLDSNPELRVIELRWRQEVPASQAAGARQPGPEHGLHIATPICFEDTVARVVRRMIHKRGEKRADAIINLSNDGWFGAYDGGRMQHAQIARFRCIENRVPMVRAVNTGCSVAIDSCGRVTERVGDGRYGRANRKGWIAPELRLDSRRTLYGRVGESWAWICLLLTAGALTRTMMASAGTSDRAPRPNVQRSP